MAKKKVSTKKQRSSANSYRTHSKPSSVSPSTASSPSPQLQDPIVAVRRRKGTPVRSPSQNDPSKGIVFSFRIQPDSELAMAVDIRSYDQQLRDDDDASADNDLVDPSSWSTASSSASVTAQEQQKKKNQLALAVKGGGALRATATAAGVSNSRLSGTASLKELQQQQPQHSANHTQPATSITTMASAYNNNNNNTDILSSTHFSPSPATATARLPTTSDSASATSMTVAEWELLQQQQIESSASPSSLTKVAGGEWSSNLWSYRENNVMDLSRNLLVLHARRPPCRSWTTAAGATPSLLGLKSRTEQRASTSLFHPYSKNNNHHCSSSSSLSSASSSQSSLLLAAASPTASSMPSTPALSSAASSASASPASSPSSPTLCQSPEQDYLTSGDGKDLLERVVVAASNSSAPLLTDTPTTLDATIPSELLAKSKSRFLTVRGLGGGRGRTRMEVIVVS